MIGQVKTAALKVGQTFGEILRFAAWAMRTNNPASKWLLPFMYGFLMNFPAFPRST